MAQQRHAIYVEAKGVGKKEGEPSNSFSDLSQLCNGIMNKPRHTLVRVDDEFSAR